MVSFNIILKYVFQGKCNLLKTPLQRIVTGCFLVAVAFIVSGILELQLKTTFPDIPSVSQVRTISIPELQLKTTFPDIPSGSQVRTISITELQLKTTFPDIPSVSQVNPPIYHNTLGLINPNNKKK